MVGIYANILTEVIKMIDYSREEEKDFYNKVGKIIGWDFSKLKYKIEDNSEFQFFNEINNKVKSNTILLDIGTGGGEKLTNLITDNCLLKIGTDFSNEMVKNANKQNIKNNIRFFEMDSKNIKFPNEFFDVISARHTPFWINEVYRILKKEGYFFTEQIDEDDCLPLKKIFGRGQGYKVQIKLSEKIKNEIKDIKFNSVEFYDIIQKEYYENEEDLLFLLNNTPIIPGFGKEKDDFGKFNEYVRNNTTDKGIVLDRRLFGIKMKK